jgi:hypothetical protein
VEPYHDHKFTREGGDAERAGGEPIDAATAFRGFGVLRRSFAPLGLFLLVTAVYTILLPLAILIGYPWLIAIGVWHAGRWFAGRLERPAQTAAVWVAYLGLILILHGIVLCFDTALAGTSPTMEQKQFGTRLAYSGGAVTALAVIVAYSLEFTGRTYTKHSGKPDLLDDPIV